MEIFFFVDVTFEKYADYVKTKALLEIMAEYFKVLGNIKHEAIRLSSLQTEWTKVNYIKVRLNENCKTFRHNEEYYSSN
jgi:hypothetical protein